MTARTVNVLLVEDNEVDVEAVQRAFRKHKIANPIIVARDGIEALDILRGDNGQAKLARPYLILLDLNLPRMTGVEFLEAIRADDELSDSIVFVLTTSRSLEDRAASYSFQIAGYMIKSEIGESFLQLVDMLTCYWRVVEFPAPRSDG